MKCGVEKLFKKEFLPNRYFCMSKVKLLNHKSGLACSMRNKIHRLIRAEKPTVPVIWPI